MSDDAITLTLEQHPDAIAFYRGAGPIFTSAGLNAIVSLDEAWQALSDLHVVASGGRISGFSLASQLTPDEAFDAYSATLAGLTGQIAATNSNAGNRLIESMNQFAHFQGGLDGLMPVWMSAFLSAGRDGVITGGMEEAAHVLGEYGLPQSIGAGLATGPLLNAGTGQLAFPTRSQIESFVQPGSSAGQLKEQLNSVIDRVAHEAGGVANPSDSSAPAGEFSAAVQRTETGAALGAVVGGLIGGPVGAGIGALIGGLLSLAGHLLDRFGPGHQAESAKAAKETAEGNKAVVTPTIIIVNGNGNTINVNTQGEKKPGQAPNQPAAEPDPHKTAPNGKVLKCRVDDDDMVPPDFSLLYWGQEFMIAPTLAPTGPGVDALMTLYNADLVSLNELFTVDHLAQIEQEGFLANALGESKALLRGSQVLRIAPVVDGFELARRQAAVQRLIEAGISAETSIDDLSVALRRKRY